MTKPPPDKAPPQQKPPTVDVARVLEFIGRCTDAAKLRQLIKNAKAQENSVIAGAAFRRLVSLVPAAQPGSVEHDFWQTIHAFEESLTEERGRTTRLVRTRQKVQRVGVVETLRDWALDSKETDGFTMLLARGLPELTGEAIVLRHPEHFGEEIRAAAKAKLMKAEVDVAALPVRA